MESASPRIRSLLRQADKVANDGKRAAAEKLYRQIIDEAPETAAAWAGLGNVLHQSKAKEESYLHALELDPNNAIAKTGLAGLSGDGNLLDHNELNPPTTQVPTNREVNKNPVSEMVSSPDPAIAPVNVAVTKDEVTVATDGHEHEVVSEAASVGVLYCDNHPSRETHLRCNRCNKPICSSCANRTPVGYRCPECIREQEDKFFSASLVDYLLTFIIVLPLSLFAGWIATFLGFWSIFLGAAAGSLIGRLAFRVAGRRRGRGMPQLVGALVVLGAIIPALIIYLGGGQISFRIIFLGIYLITASGAAYYQMR